MRCFEELIPKFGLFEGKSWEIGEGTLKSVGMGVFMCLSGFSKEGYGPFS